MIKHKWDDYFGIYKIFKGKRFPTIKKKAKNLDEVIDDILLLAALEGEYAHKEAKRFADICSNQIIPLREKGGDDAVALALCCYLYCHLNDPKVIIAEVYDLFNQIGKSVEEINKHKKLSGKILDNLHNMGYYAGLAGALTKSNMFRVSRYNDDDRRRNWPVKLPNDLSLDDLFNVASLLSSIVFFAVDLQDQSTTVFIGLTQTNRCASGIMKEINKNTNKENG